MIGDDYREYEKQRGREKLVRETLGILLGLAALTLLALVIFIR